MAFDPNAFSQPVDPLTTVYEVCPEGEFQMMIDSDPKQIQVTTDDTSTQFGIRRHVGTSQRTGEPYDFTDWTLACVVMDEKVKARLGRDKVIVRMRLNLDLDENGKIATGPNKNVGLGQLRDALGQNKPGWMATSLLGAGTFIGKVSHTADKTNPSKKYADVTRVAKIS